MVGVGSVSPESTREQRELLLQRQEILKEMGLNPVQPED